MVSSKSTSQLRVSYHCFSKSTKAILWCFRNHLDMFSVIIIPETNLYGSHRDFGPSILSDTKTSTKEMIH